MPLGAILEKGQDFVAEGRLKEITLVFRAVAGVGGNVLEAENQSH